jgi:hypothetical protein
MGFAGVVSRGGGEERTENWELKTENFKLAGGGGAGETEFAVVGDGLRLLGRGWGGAGDGEEFVRLLVFDAAGRTENWELSRTE